MLPRLWIAYDFVSIEECLTTLDAVLARHPDRSIIHEIGRPTILNAALEGVPIVAEFRARLRNGSYSLPTSKDTTSLTAPKAATTMPLAPT
jgi:hypothetical protein